MNTKYEITDIAHEEFPFLHRIRALRDISEDVKADGLGGFVEEVRLIQWYCWILTAHFCCVS